MATSFLIEGGTVFDGTGAPPRSADVLVIGDRIARIGECGTLPRFSDVLTVNAAGRVVSPGFIDVHTHDDLEVLRAPEMCCKVSQGVTTVVVGNCGLGVAPLTPEIRSAMQNGRSSQSAILGLWSPLEWESVGGYLQVVDQTGPAVNVAALVPHNTVRSAICGNDERPSTAEEIVAMQELVDEGMREGALGLSTGLIYQPGRAASTEELVALCRVVGRYGGLYVTHLRDEADRVDSAVREAISIGENSGCGIHISHLKAAGRANWGRIPAILRDLPAQATVDVYPYSAASTSMREALLAGGMTTPVQPSDVVVASAPGCEEAEGRTLTAIAQLWGVEPGRAADILEARSSSGVSVVYFAMDESDVVEVLSFDRAMFGSDGLPSQGRPHPRLYGTFPRVIGHYCRDLHRFPLADAIRRMTSFPASRFNLKDRGVLKEGSYADLVVFDAESIVDTATYDEPASYARGIELVMVNGVVSWEQGECTGRRGGRALRRGT